MDNNDRLIDLEKEFKRTVKSFVNKELNERWYILNTSVNEINLINEDNYIYEIQKYFEEETDFKGKIIEKAKRLIYNDKEAEGDWKSIIDKLF